MASAARAAAKESSLGSGMAALEVAEAPVAVFGKLVGAADAAQALAALHAVEQRLEHGAGGLAEGDDKDALVAGEIDGGRAAAVGQQAVERIALKAKAAVEGRGDVAGLDGAGKDFGGRGVQSVESGIADRGHEQLLLEPAGERMLHRLQLTGKEVIGAGKEHQSFGFGGGGGHLRQLCGGRELVVVSAEKELGNGAVVQGRIAVVVAVGLGGQAERDESADIGGGIAGWQQAWSAMAAPKLKPTATSGRLYSFSSQSSAASTSPVSARPSCVPWLRPVPRKLKRRTGQAESPGRIVEGLHGVVDDLVVQGAAAQGVGMADERGKGSVGSAFVQKRFKTAGGTGQDPVCAVPGFR